MLTKVVTSLTNDYTGFNRVFAQNDMHEFAMIAINKMTEEFGIKLSTLVLDRLKDDTVNQCNTVEERFVAMLKYNWYLSFKLEYSDLVPLFHSHQVNQLKCDRCHRISHNMQPYNCLSVPIVDNIDTLDGLMDEYFAPRRLEERDCEYCKKTRPHDYKQSALESFKLWKNAKILVIQLKRFNSLNMKQTSPINAPQHLDITRFTMSRFSIVYDLKAIGCHMGSTTSGHYYTLGKVGDQWYKFDDDEVTKVDNIEMASAHHYMYFYERI